MKKKNKPNWLIDAESEIKKFEDTKYGKMDSRSFIQNEKMEKMLNASLSSEAYKENAKRFGERAKIEGWLNKARERNIELGNIHRLGKEQGKKNVENGLVGKGGKATEAARGQGAKTMKENADADATEFIKLLPLNFTQQEAYDIAINFGKSQSWCKGFLRNHIYKYGWLKQKIGRIYHYSK